MEDFGSEPGGGRGIRTPDDREAITDFKSAGFNHSPIPPKGLPYMDVFAGVFKPFHRDKIFSMEVAVGRLQGFSGVVVPEQSGFRRHDGLRSPSEAGFPDP